MKHWGKLLIGGLSVAFVFTVNAAGTEMSHWAQIRDESGEVIGRVEEGENVEILGECPDNPSRTMVYYPAGGLKGSVASVYIYGGTEYEYENPYDYVYKGTQQAGETGTEGTGDSEGNTSYENVWVDVNISAQTIAVYSGETLLLYDACVTGTDGERDTPVGDFCILDKAESTVLSGGEGENSYASSVQYWMPITEYGVGIHDAAWRYGDFGGDIYQYNGSHGCINVDSYVAATIFDMVDVGTPVSVHY